MEQVTLVVVMITIGVMVATIFNSFLKRLIRQIKINKALDAFPSQPRHWLYGSREQKKSGPKESFLNKHIKRTQKYPRGYRVWQGPFSSALVIAHPDLIRPVLKVSDPKSKTYTQSLKPWLGDGLLIANGHKWLRDRRLITPAFHFDVLKSYVQVFNDATEVFMKKLDCLIEKKEPLRLFENISLLTFDIILQCAFSYQTDCQQPGKRHPYTVNVYELAQTWNKRLGNVWCALFPPLYWFTTEGQKFSRLCDSVHKEADSIINQRKALLDEQVADVLTKKKLDFLDILLTAKDEDGNGMAAADIRAEVDTFLFAGHDTTATGISWMLYLMAKHPNHQEEVQAEIDKVMLELGTDQLDKSVFSHLSFLTRCLKESKRLFSPIPIIARQLSQDLVIDGNKVLAGTTVNIPIWALHHNPLVWGDDHMKILAPSGGFIRICQFGPSIAYNLAIEKAVVHQANALVDMQEYKPERFSEENMKKQDPFAYIPFSAGPRNCIGQNFALNEEKIVVARLLHRYTFSLPENSQPPSPSVRIVLQPEEEIYLEVTPRL